MRKKKQISLRIEWIETIATLITSLQLEVMNAVIAYLTDGTVTKIDNIDAAEMFMSIKNDIDARAEERRRKAAERRAKKAPVPGYLPEKAPENLDERVAANGLVDWVVSCHSFKDFRRFDKPLLAELALQVCDWWREHPSEELPSQRTCPAGVRLVARASERRVAEPAENTRGDKRPFRQSCRRARRKYLCDPRKMARTHGSVCRQAPRLEAV